MSTGLSILVDWSSVQHKVQSSPYISNSGAVNQAYTYLWRTQEGPRGVHGSGMEKQGVGPPALFTATGAQGTPPPQSLISHWGTPPCQLAAGGTPSKKD